MIRYTTLDGWLDTFNCPNFGDINYSMREALSLYALHGVQLGGFGRALIAGDLASASVRADLENTAVLPKLVQWCQVYLPPEARGSYDAVNTWKGCRPRL